jgi:hypothetical protein
MYKPGGTIADALGAIQKKDYVLPAIQREFVWKPDQIERLFDSLGRSYRDLPSTLEALEYVDVDDAPAPGPGDRLLCRINPVHGQDHHYEGKVIRRFGQEIFHGLLRADYPLPGVIIEAERDAAARELQQYLEGLGYV